MTTIRWLCTSGTDAVNFKAMIAHPKSVISSDTFQHSRDFIIAEFDQLIAFLTDEVIVLRIAVVVFVNFAITARDSQGAVVRGCL